MKRLLLLGGVVAVLVGVSVLPSRDSRGQFQVNPQVDQRVGPIYPPNPSYNFYSHGGDADPFQFNWYSGRWDYVPIPWNNDRPWLTHPAQQPYVWNPNLPQYSVVNNSGGGLTPGAVPANQPVPPSQNPPDDTGLWNPPTSRPAEQMGTQTVEFSGRIVGIRAIMIEGTPYPHLLLRLNSKSGANGTVDAGEKLEFPPAASPTDLDIDVQGKLGTIDGNLVLFGDKICFGSHMCEMVRHGGASPSSTPTPNP
jgi:hypothetical protein